MASNNRPEHATCLSRIIAMLPSLNPVERKVGEYVKSHADDCLTLPIGSLAKNAGCSPGTVTRFVTSLGYENYKEFTIELAKDLASRPARIAEEFEDSDSFEDTIGKVFQLQAASLHDTEKLLNIDTLRAVVERIAKARTTCVFGCGESGVVALYAQTRFQNIGLRVHAYRDSYEQLAVSAGLGKDDIAIGVSHSGQTRPVGEALSVARNNGATTVALTNRDASPLAECADYVLLTAHENRKLRTVSYASYFALLCLVDLLYLMVARHSIKELSPAWEQIEDVVQRYFFKSR